MASDKTLFMLGVVVIGICGLIAVLFAAGTTNQSPGTFPQITTMGMVVLAMVFGLALWLVRNSFLTQPSPVVMDAKVSLYLEISEAIDTWLEAGEFESDPNGFTERLRPFRPRIQVLAAADVFMRFNTLLELSPRYYGLAKARIEKDPSIEALRKAMRIELTGT